MKEKNKIRALIIDDEIEICFLLSKLLSTRAIESVYAGTLSEARSILETFTPSIIFMDNHLPDGLGVEFLRYIKSGNPQVKIVIITGHDTNLTGAFEKGASEIIFKPFSSDKIFAAIKEIA